MSENSKFVYVIYIRTNRQQLWDALTKPEFTRSYWCETWQDTTWKKGSAWKLMIPDGRVGDAGEILECEPPARLVLKWRNEFVPEMKKDGYSRCTLELEPAEGAVKLTVTHEMPKKGAKFIEAVSKGWPAILSSLKSLMETGDALAATKRWPKDM